MVAAYGARLCSVGLAIGLCGAFALRRFLASLVFEVNTSDPWIYAVAAELLAAAGMLACYVPARRASRIDPIEALRSN